ncbi:MAG: CBS domain-containing protein [Deltaproteobacteria bacterium]|nr:CBS domain-containing protein [Deltaproteobacteria bacterium]
MLVRHCMSQNVVTIPPDAPLRDAWALLHRHAIRQLPVMRRERLVGIVTDRDLRSAPQTASSVAEVMTARPMVIPPETPLDEAARLLRRHRFGALPVVEDKQLVGILACADVLDAFVELSGVAEASYHLVLTGTDGAESERNVRGVIAQKHGELKWVHRDKHRRPEQLHLRLRAKNIEDIVDELEAVGFEVSALVASKGRNALV